MKSLLFTFFNSQLLNYNNNNNDNNKNDIEKKDSEP